MYSDYISCHLVSLASVHSSALVSLAGERRGQGCLSHHPRACKPSPTLPPATLPPHSARSRLSKESGRPPCLPLGLHPRGHSTVSAARRPRIRTCGREQRLQDCCLLSPTIKLSSSSSLSSLSPSPVIMRAQCLNTHTPVEMGEGGLSLPLRACVSAGGMYSTPRGRGGRD